MDTSQTVEYLDWSGNSYANYESGHKAGRYAELTFDINDVGVLTVHLRRQSSRMRDFTFFVHDPKALYEALREHFEG